MMVFLDEAPIDGEHDFSLLPFLLNFQDRTKKKKLKNE